MDPERWGNQDWDYFGYDLKTLKLLKEWVRPFRNRSMVLHVFFITGGFLVFSLGFIGFLKVTGTWDQTILNGANTDEMIHQRQYAYSVGFVLVTLYLVIGIIQALGGPFLNFILWWVIPLSTRFAIITHYNPYFSIERSTSYFGYPAWWREIFVQAGPGIVLMFVAIELIDRWKENNMEKARRWEYRYSPVPLTEEGKAGNLPDSETSD